MSLVSLPILSAKLHIQMSKRCVIVAEKEDEEVEVSVRKRIYQGKMWDFY